MEENEEDSEKILQIIPINRNDIVSIHQSDDEPIGEIPVVGLALVEVEFYDGRKRQKRQEIRPITAFGGDEFPFTIDCWDLDDWKGIKILKKV